MEINGTEHKKNQWNQKLNQIHKLQARLLNNKRKFFGKGDTKFSLLNGKTILEKISKNINKNL